MQFYCDGTLSKYSGIDSTFTELFYLAYCLDVSACCTLVNL